MSEHFKYGEKDSMSKKRTREDLKYFIKKVFTICTQNGQYIIPSPLDVEFATIQFIKHKWVKVKNDPSN